MQKYLVAIAMLVTVACAKTDRTADSVKKDLTTAQTEMDSIQAKVTRLEQELSDLTGNESGSVTKIRVATLVPSSFEHIFETNANVEAKNAAYISPEMGGQVKAIYVEQGQRVAKGTLLISLNSLAMRSQLDELKGGLGLAQVLYKKQKELWDQNIGSEVQYLQAKNAVESLENKIKATEAQIAMSEIRAPFAGVVDEIYLKVGELAAPGQRLLDFVDLGRMIIKADVSESAIQHVKVGDVVSVSLPNFPEWKQTTRVARVGNIINPANRTFSVECEIQNTDGMLKPNQIASINLRDFHSDEALVVPAIVLRKDIKGDFVFVAQNQGGYMAAKKVYVKLAESYQGRTRVYNGLKAGDQVLTEGFNLVREGSAVEIVK
jgi:RND family efflux transporter MFP subunit